MNTLAAFHFLRPAWLLVLLPGALVVWAMLRRQDAARGLKSVIAPDLLVHLVVSETARKQRLRPVYMLAAGWLIAAVALAGPAWHKEQAPFGEDRSALFVVQKVTPTMLAQDIQPSRLARSAQKVSGLLALRPGTRTGLVAYAGSAHLVMPLTTDAEIITWFGAELDPDVMPVPGDDPVRAVELAVARLDASGMAGSIVLVADAIDPSAREGLARVHRESGIDIHVYAAAAGPDVVPPAGSPPAPFLDAVAMREAAQAGGGTYVSMTPDEGDLRALTANVTRSIAAAPAQEGERWTDAGYWLLWPLLGVFLLFWRRGGGVALEIAQ